MYSSLTILKKYVQYFFKASNGKGHGVHSPFVFSFIKEVLNKNPNNQLFASIEKQRKKLETSAQCIQIWDQGAGSRQTDKTERAVCEIAKVALKPKKYSQLLHKIVAYYKPTQVLEMGTSLGITTCYLAVAGPAVKVVTMEGAANVATVARNTFKELGVQNIEIIEGNFDDTLPNYLNSIEHIGLAYIDGNHRYEPTMRYFEDLLQKSNDQSILIFDDIHWSSEMEQSWAEIKAHPSVTLTIDLFFIGLVFVRSAQKEKEHFIIRY